MGIKCSDVVYLMAEQVADLYPGFICDEDKLSNTMKQARAIDKFAEDVKATGFDVSIDESSFDVKVMVFIEKLEIDKPGHIFFEVLRSSKTFTVNLGDEDGLDVEFVFDGFLVEKDE